MNIRRSSPLQGHPHGVRSSVALQTRVRRPHSVISSSIGGLGMGEEANDLNSTTLPHADPVVACPRCTPRNTGPLEGRDFGATGRRLGTAVDCYDGSPWELHRGELWERMGSKDIHGIVTSILVTLFRNHARPGLTVMTDVYCDLSDATAESLRAPDVVLVGGLSKPKDDFFRSKPILAVEVRATQSKRHLEEKVRLYLEHDWPWIWIAHTEREELEVVRAGLAPVVYPRGTNVDVPLLPELDKHGLAAVPAGAFFDEGKAERYLDGWVRARGEALGRAHAILGVLTARGLDLPEAARVRIAAVTDLATLDRWLGLAATVPDAATFVEAVGR